MTRFHRAFEAGVCRITSLRNLRRCAWVAFALGGFLIGEQLTIDSKVLNEERTITISPSLQWNAQRLYRSVLGENVGATLANLYSADEVTMVVRDVKI